MNARPRKTEYLLDRDGRFFARIVIPKQLRPFMEGRTELRTALGPDRRQAKKLLATAVADLQQRVGIAQRQMEAATGKSAAITRWLAASPWNLHRCSSTLPTPLKPDAMI